MKVLYIANFQGPELIKRRNIRRNRSLAGTPKMCAIITALVSLGHDVEIYSTGTSAEWTGKIYRSFGENIAASERMVPIHYSWCLDLPILNRYTSTFSLLINLKKFFKRKTFDVAIVYNCDMESLVAAWYCRFVRSIPVVLEYEDSVVTQRVGKTSLIRRARRINELIMRRLISGIFACTPEIADAIGHANRLILHGALNQDLIDMAARRIDNPNDGRPKRLIYAGNLDISKGVDIFMEAVELIEHPLEIHVCGKGSQENVIAQMCRKSRHKATFHGVVSRERLYELLTSADIAVNPHRLSWDKGAVWPFKVAEYLAACGVVVCARTRMIEKDLEENLHLYEGDDPVILADAIREVIDNWENERICAPDRMRWAIDKWGPKGFGRDIEQLLVKAGD